MIRRAGTLQFRTVDLPGPRDAAVYQPREHGDGSPAAVPRLEPWPPRRTGRAARHPPEGSPKFIAADRALERYPLCGIDVVRLHSTAFPFTVTVRTRMALRGAPSGPGTLKSE